MVECHLNFGDFKIACGQWTRLGIAKVFHDFRRTLTVFRKESFRSGHVGWDQVNHVAVHVFTHHEFDELLRGFLVFRAFKDGQVPSAKSTNSGSAITCGAIHKAPIDVRGLQGWLLQCWPELDRKRAVQEQLAHRAGIGVQNALWRELCQILQVFHRFDSWRFVQRTHARAVQNFATIGEDKGVYYDHSVFTAVTKEADTEFTIACHRFGCSTQAVKCGQARSIDASGIQQILIVEAELPYVDVERNTVKAVIENRAVPSATEEAVT